MIASPELHPGYRGEVEDKRRLGYHTRTRARAAWDRAHAHAQSCRRGAEHQHRVLKTPPPFALTWMGWRAVLTFPEADLEIEHDGKRAGNDVANEPLSSLPRSSRRPSCKGD
jgi:hypothetical protein